MYTYFIMYFHQVIERIGAYQGVTMGRTSIPFFDMQDSSRGLVGGWRTRPQGLPFTAHLKVGGHEHDAPGPGQGTCKRLLGQCHGKAGVRLSSSITMASVP